MADTGRNILSRIKKTVHRDGAYKKAVVDFANKHQLVYFDSIGISGKDIPTLRSSTSSPDQKDHHFCVGTHAGYDMNILDRSSLIRYEGYESLDRRWYVLQIDLKRARNLPFIFVGTRQQTKAYYARLLSSHRELRYLSLASTAKKQAAFHAHYALLASPAHTPVIYRLFDAETIDSIAAHAYPFAIEIEDESLTVITEATTNQQLLDKLLHYGLWLTKRIDERLG